MDNKDAPQMPGDGKVQNPPGEENLSSSAALDSQKAKIILSAVAQNGPPQDPVLTRVASTAVLTGTFERSLFYSDTADDAGRKVVKDVLCRLLILEADYLNYSGGGKSAGLSLTQMLANTRGLLDESKALQKPLKDTLDSAVNDSKVDDIQGITDIQTRFGASIEKLEGIVTALSQPETAGTPYSHQKFVAPAPAAPGKTTPGKPQPAKTTKAAAKKAERRQDTIKTVIALVVAAVILGASGMYVKSLLTKKPTLVVYNADDYKDILVLKEARNEGTSFIGIVDDTYWNSLTNDEKMDRATRLLARVKGGSVQGLVLRGAGDTLFAMTYGDQVRVFK